MLITGGLTVVTVGLGSVFGVLAISTWNDVEDAARNGGCRDPSAYKGCLRAIGDMEARASSYATISTFCFLAGGLALAGTTLLWMTGPPREPLWSTLGRPAGRSSARPKRSTLRIQVAPAFGPGGGFGAIRGTF
jgi:hypothetical protein